MYVHVHMCVSHTRLTHKTASNGNSKNSALVKTVSHTHLRSLLGLSTPRTGDTDLRGDASLRGDSAPSKDECEPRKAGIDAENPTRFLVPIIYDLSAYSVTD